MNVGQPYNPHRLFKGIFIPDPVALNEQLSLGARMCFGVLCRFSGARGDCFPSAVAIGSRIHLGERQVREYLVELEKYGLIRRRRRPQQASVIEFLWHQDFNDPEYFLQDSWEEPTAESRRSENRGAGHAAGVGDLTRLSHRAGVARGELDAVVGREQRRRWRDRQERLGLRHRL